MKTRPEENAIPDQEGIVEEIVKKLLEKSPLPKQKTSFNVARGSQLALKKLSEKYGINQGDIIGLAPFIFAKIAENCIERRRNSLQTLKTLYEQACRSIESMIEIAPHLRHELSYLPDMLLEIIEAEENAVTEQNIKSVPFPSDGSSFLGLLECGENDENRIAYHEDIKNFLGCNEFDKLFSLILEKESSKPTDTTKEGK